LSLFAWGINLNSSVFLNSLAIANFIFKGAILMGTNRGCSIRKLLDSDSYNKKKLVHCCQNIKPAPQEQFKVLIKGVFKSDNDNSLSGIVIAVGKIQSESDPFGTQRIA